MHIKVGLIAESSYCFKVPFCDDGRALPQNDFNIFVNNAQRYVSGSTQSQACHGAQFRWKGVIIDLVETIARLENFTYEYVERLDGSFGRPQLSGNSTSSALEWDGLLGQLQRGLVDVSGAPMTETARRLTDFAFVPITTDPPQFVIAKQNLVPSGDVMDNHWFEFDYVIKPFHFYTWLAILCNGVFLALFLALLELVLVRLSTIYHQTTMEHRSSHFRRAINTIYDMWENIFGLFLSRGVSVMPVSVSAKTLLIISTLACMALTSLYSAQMASMAIVKSTHVPFDSFTSMKTAGYTLLVESNGAPMDLLLDMERDQRSKGQLAEASAIRKQLREPESGWPPNAEIAFKAVRDNKYVGLNGRKIVGPFVTIGTHSQMAFEQTPECDFVPVFMPHSNVGIHDKISFVFRRGEESQEIRQLFVSGMQRMGQMAIDGHYLQHSTSVYNNYVRRSAGGNQKMSSQLVCGGIWPKQRWVSSKNHSSRLHVDRTLNKRNSAGESDNKFSPLTIIGLRSVFFILVLGSGLGMFGLAAELALHMHARRARTMFEKNKKQANESPEVTSGNERPPSKRLRDEISELMRPIVTDEKKMTKAEWESICELAKDKEASKSFGVVSSSGRNPLWNMNPND